MKSIIKNRSMVNHSIFSRGIKYDYINILTWTILKKTQILNGCVTFAFKYIITEESSVYEPRHEISNNVVVAISKASDQPAPRRSLIRAFACRLIIL